MTQFYMPVKMLEGEHCIWNHRKEMTSLGRKALIVTGRHSAKRNGAYEDVKRALEAEGVAHLLFDQVEENPSMETVMKARDIAIDAGVDFVIGIGGGSPMDAAKAIALMAVHKGEGQSYLYRKGADSKALPVVEVPTTCGTGSEVTPYAILTNTEANTKGSLPHKVWAAVAYFDYRYLQTASAKVLCDTAMDAFGHMVESYINFNANVYSRMCVDSGLRLWTGCKKQLLSMANANRLYAESADRKDEQFQEKEKLVLQNLLRASAMAGMAISVTGTSMPHALSYGLTCNLGMTHGKAVGYFLSYYLAEAAKEDREHILTLAGFEDIADMESFYKNTCGRADVPQQLLEHIGEALLQNEAKLKNCPYQVDADIMKRILGL